MSHTDLDKKTMDLLTAIRLLLDTAVRAESSTGIVPQYLVDAYELNGLRHTFDIFRNQIKQPK